VIATAFSQDLLPQLLFRTELLGKAARVQAEKAMTVPRVGVRFAENAMENVIRQVSLLAHAADNSATSGPAFKALFPWTTSTRRSRS
jgi:hypothetical protein